jgi:hypothetical protein
MLLFGAFSALLLEQRRGPILADRAHLGRGVCRGKGCTA